MGRVSVSIFVKKSEMTFSQRFTRYLIGVGIGLIVVFFMFPQYDWLGWLPQKQVMQNIRESDFYFGHDTECKMECLGVSREQIQLARSEGRIDFSESDVKRNPKLYHLEYGNLDMKIELTDSTARLVDIISAGKMCNCP
jgi:hypothetical protein